MAPYEREGKFKQPADLKELLSLALNREKTSIGLYDDMLRHSFSDEMKEFITVLKKEEMAHKARIESKLKELD